MRHGTRKSSGSLSCCSRFETDNKDGSRETSIVTLAEDGNSKGYLAMAELVSLRVP